MGRIDSVVKQLKDRRDRVLKGLYNCLPFPFPRFRMIFPGIEKGKFIVITANQKVGKSKLSDYLFVYEPLFFTLQHPEIKVKVIYFTLEVSPNEKYYEFLCYLLFKLDNIIISTTELKSTDKALDSKIFDLIESPKYKYYIEAFEKMVIYKDDPKNPTGINKYCRNYALENGHLNFKKEKRTNEIGEIEEFNIVDSDNPYTPNDPDEIRIIILDNASNLTLESGMSKMETIDKMSKYAIGLRNQLQYVFVLIQHQAQQQEGIENLKLGKLKPSSDGLAECKTTTRDVNLVIGLYSPYKYGLREYEGYDITKFKNYIRFMEIIEDRDYGANGRICPLFFNGAVSTFHELPRADNTDELNKIYRYISSLEEQKTNKIFFAFSRLFTKKKKQIE